MRISLPIKKEFFDAILERRKRFEYRAATPYYAKLFRSRPTTLRLHYYKAPALEATILSIRKIRTPKALLSTGIAFPSHVYAIALKDPRRIR